MTAMANLDSTWVQGQLVNARWRRSRRSSGGTNCVEVAFLDGGPVAVRDSKRPHGPCLVLTTLQYQAWVAGIKAAKVNSR